MISDKEQVDNISSLINGFWKNATKYLISHYFLWLSGGYHTQVLLTIEDFHRRNPLKLSENDSQLEVVIISDAMTDQISINIVLIAQLT